jgi:hypothetical protein
LKITATEEVWYGMYGIGNRTEVHNSFKKRNSLLFTGRLHAMELITNCMKIPKETKSINGKT